MKNLNFNAFIQIFFIISLIIIFFLLNSCYSPAFGNEIILNTSLSVDIPDDQSGNPGDFLTTVLLFQNRSANQVILEVEYGTARQWNIIGDSQLIIPAYAGNYHFPVTIFIPQNALANTTEQIAIRFKPLDNSYNLPMIYLPVKINPVSSVNFTVPPSQKGVYGSKVNYTISISNNGNTTEQIAADINSENAWPVTFDSLSIQLKPGETVSIEIEHQIPAFTEQESDQLKITFSWNNQQKVIILETTVTDKSEQLADSFYIWQGQFGISHPDLSKLGSYQPFSSFYLNGQITSDSWGQFYLSDFLNDENRRWFTQYRNSFLELKTGDFSLTWPGLFLPSSSVGNLYLNQKLPNRSFSLYTWQNQHISNSAQPFGFETNLTKNTSIRLLHQPYPEATSNIIELSNEFAPSFNTRLKQAIAFDVSNNESNGLLLRLEKPLSSNWLLYSTYSYQSNYSDFLSKRMLNLILNHPPSESKPASQAQFEYATKKADEADELTGLFSENSYVDYWLDYSLFWPGEHKLRFSRSYHYLNNLSSSINSTLYLESLWITKLFHNTWWFSYSLDQNPDLTTSYAKLNLTTRYGLSKNLNLLINPQLISNSVAVKNESKLGVGLEQKLDYILDWNSLIYSYLQSSSKWEWKFELNWRIYQYQLSLGYLGSFTGDHFSTSSFNLTFNQRFSVPLQKPLGAIEGFVYHDRNLNGIMDQGEPPLSGIDLLLDGKTPVRSDANGRYQISGIDPGEHQIELNDRYQVIYYPVTQNSFSLKPYKTRKHNIPLFRTQSVTGIIYFDKNANRQMNIDEPGLTGIPLTLLNEQGHKVAEAFTGQAGQFIFSQVAPGIYDIQIEQSQIPENMQVPSSLMLIRIDANKIEEIVPLEVGLLPFDKPIEIITEIGPQISLFLDKELIHPGAIMLITLETSANLKELSLILPDQTIVQLKPAERQTYQWKVPNDINSGEYVVICRGLDQNGQMIEEKSIVIILQKK